MSKYNTLHIVGSKRNTKTVSASELGSIVNYYFPEVKSKSYKSFEEIVTRRFGLSDEEAAIYDEQEKLSQPTFLFQKGLDYENSINQVLIEKYGEEDVVNFNNEIDDETGEVKRLYSEKLGLSLVPDFFVKSQNRLVEVKYANHKTASENGKLEAYKLQAVAQSMLLEDLIGEAVSIEIVMNDVVIVEITNEAKQHYSSLIEKSILNLKSDLSSGKIGFLNLQQMLDLLKKKPTIHLPYEQELEAKFIALAEANEMYKSSKHIEEMYDGAKKSLVEAILAGEQQHATTVIYEFDGKDGTNYKFQRTVHQTTYYTEDDIAKEKEKLQKKLAELDNIKVGDVKTLGGKEITKLTI